MRPIRDGWPTSDQTLRSSSVKAAWGLRVRKREIARHAFVDETKERGHILVVAMLREDLVTDARRAVRASVLPHQRRIRFATESDGRRKQIMKIIIDLHPTVIIYDASGHPDQVRGRELCLWRLTADLDVAGTRKVVLETDGPAVARDRSVLYRAVRKHRLVGVLDYYHMTASQEPLLSIPDAVAWCWRKSGSWRSLVRERLQPTVHRL